MKGLPYCGAPPLPGGASWTLDPLLLLALAAGGLALARCTRGADGATRGVAALGWLLLAGALVSPLCNLAVALFSARVAQHLLVALVAAPLIAVALLQRAAPRAPVPAAAAFAGLFWFWHLPGPYAGSFHPDGIAWWWMHGTLVLAALWLWAAILGARRDRPVGAVLAALLTGLQMGALGALLTFAPRPLYAQHAPDVTLPWGLAPLEDQQLGGLLMWVPGGLLFAAAMVVAFAALLRHPSTAGRAAS